MAENDKMSAARILVKRTVSTDPDFQALVKLLDQDLARRDVKDHAFFAQINKGGLPLLHVLVVYENEVAVGCGALRPCTDLQLLDNQLEIKRMWVNPDRRRQGFARLLLSELEIWALELGYQSVQLETGRTQPEAIALYQKAGYIEIPRYGPYLPSDISVCFTKKLKRSN